MLDIYLNYFENQNLGQNAYILIMQIRFFILNHGNQRVGQDTCFS